MTTSFEKTEFLKAFKKSNEEQKPITFDGSSFIVGSGDKATTKAAMKSGGFSAKQIKFWLKKLDFSKPVKISLSIWTHPTMDEIRIYINNAFDNDKVWLTFDGDDFPKINFKRPEGTPISRTFINQTEEKAYQILKEMNTTTWAEALAAAK